MQSIYFERLLCQKLISERTLAEVAAILPIFRDDCSMRKSCWKSPQLSLFHFCKGAISGFHTTIWKLIYVINSLLVHKKLIKIVNNFTEMLGSEVTLGRLTPKIASSSLGLSIQPKPTTFRQPATMRHIHK